MDGRVRLDAEKPRKTKPQPPQNWRSDAELVAEATPQHLEASKAAKRKARDIRTTERSYLRRVIAEISSDAVAAVARRVIEQAIEGDKDARAWLGKYLLGNGKISLDELHHPPLSRPRRGR